MVMLYHEGKVLEYIAVVKTPLSDGPHTDPGEWNYRIGILENTRFRISIVANYFLHQSL